MDLKTFVLYHWSAAVGWLIVLLGLIFGGGSVAALLPKLKTVTDQGFAWLKAHAIIKGHQVSSVLLQRVIGMIQLKVDEYEGTVIEDLKTKAAAGQITGDDLVKEYKKLAEQFRNESRNLLTFQGIWGAFVQTFGGGTEAGAFTFLDTLKNATVSQLPPSGLQTSEDGVTPPAMAVGATKTASVSTPPTATNPAAPAVPPPAAA